MDTKIIVLLIITVVFVLIIIKPIILFIKFKLKLSAVKNAALPLDNEVKVKVFPAGNQNVKLVSAGINKITLLKAIITITGYGLKEAKDLIDSAPSIICKNIDMYSALEIKQELEAAGAIVTIENSDTEFI